MLKELGDDVQRDDTKNEISTKIFDKTVQVICAFTRLPDVQDNNAPKGAHDGFIPHLRNTLEPVYHELAHILRLYKVFRKANGMTPRA